jgi:hypothetical protein
MADLAAKGGDGAADQALRDVSQPARPDRG